MPIRFKMILVFFCLATLPLLTLWGAQKDLQQTATHEFLSFVEDAFVDWVDGEFENISLDTSLALREKLENLKKSLTFQTQLLEE